LSTQSTGPSEAPTIAASSDFSCLSHGSACAAAHARQDASRATLRMLGAVPRLGGGCGLCAEEAAGSAGLPGDRPPYGTVRDHIPIEHEKASAKSLRAPEKPTHAMPLT
jgi:hypothetical protein